MNGVGSLMNTKAVRPVNWRVPAVGDGPIAMFNKGNSNYPTTILLVGVDTLVIGFYATHFTLSPRHREELKDAKRSAGADLFKNSGFPIVFQGRRFYMQASSRRPHKYVLTSGDFTVKVADRPSKKKQYPEVVIEFRSQFLWHAGYMQAFEDVRDWVRTWAPGADEVVSRADLTVDLSGNHQPDIGDIVSKAREKNEYFDVHTITSGKYAWHGKERTGITIGSGSCQLKVYNKTVEIKKSGKTWFEDMWSQKGWTGKLPDDQSTVTRIEFQLQRDFFNDYGITTFQQFCEKTADLHSYLVTNWASVRVQKGKNCSRWPIADWWQAVQSATALFGEKQGALTKKHIRKATLDRMLPMAVGVLTKAISLTESGNIGEFMAEASDYLERAKDMTFTQAVADKQKHRKIALPEEPDKQLAVEQEEDK